MGPDPKLWNELEENLNSIGGRTMEKPRTAGIETLIKEENQMQDFWVKFREGFNLWANDYRAKVESKLHNSEARVETLEKERTLLAREVVRLRKINAQIGELLGLQRAEKR